MDKNQKKLDGIIKPLFSTNIVQNIKCDFIEQQCKKGNGSFNKSSCECTYTP